MAFIHFRGLDLTDFNFDDTSADSYDQSSPTQIFKETSKLMGCSCYRIVSGKGYNLISTGSNKLNHLSYANELLNLYD